MGWVPDQRGKGGEVASYSLIESHIHSIRILASRRGLHLEHLILRSRVSGVSKDDPDGTGNAALTPLPHGRGEPVVPLAGFRVSVDSLPLRYASAGNDTGGY